MLDLLKLIRTSFISIGDIYSLRKDYLKEIQSLELAFWFVSKCLPVTHQLYIETLKITDDKRSLLQSRIYTEK